MENYRLNISKIINIDSNILEIGASQSPLIKHDR